LLLEDCDFILKLALAANSNAVADTAEDGKYEVAHLV
jgi:hypothetical protein